MSKQDWYPLKKSQRRYITQLLEYMESEEIFDKKDSFDILSMKDVPGVPYSSSKMATRYTMKPKVFMENLRDLLDRGYYTEVEKDALSIIRNNCKQRNYPFQDFKFEPNKKTDKLNG